MQRRSRRRPAVNSRLPTDFVRRVEEFAHSDEVEWVLDMVSDKYVEGWRTSPPDQANRREHLYRMVQAVEALKNEIRSITQEDIVTAYNKGLRSRPL